MPLTYTNGSNGIFDILGKLFNAISVTNIARGTTVPTSIDGLIDKFKNDTATSNAMERAFAVTPGAQFSWQGNGDALVAQLAQVASGYLRGVVTRDAVQPADTIDNALRYLISQMIIDGRFVDPNVVNLVLTPNAGNSVNDLAILFTFKGGDGRDLQNQLGEAIAIDLTAASPEAVTIRSLGRESRAGLSHEWPRGSGHGVQIGAADPGATLLTNGDLDDMGVANIPDGWALLDGLPGTAYLMSGYEVQNVVIAGTPTAGGYYLRYTSPAGPVFVTPRLAFDAPGEAVQDALRAIPELAQVTVATTGTTPNFTHAITFTGVAGNLTLLAAESQLNTGTVTPSEVTAGDADAFRGRTLKVVGSAAVNRRIYQQLAVLEPDTVYFVAVRHKKNNTPAAGTVRLAIVNGYGGAVTQDSAGGNNSTTFDLTTGAVTTAYTSGSFSFRLKPSQQLQPVYLEINVQNLAAGTTYFIDEIVLVQGTSLYAGGPVAAAVLGKVAPALADKWTLTASNDRAGSFQEWFARVYDMRSRGLLLPTTGSVNIPDSLIG